MVRSDNDHRQRAIDRGVKRRRQLNVNAHLVNVDRWVTLIFVK
jgi:hypothetical protein